MASLTLKSIVLLSMTISTFFAVAAAMPSDQFTISTSLNASDPNALRLPLDFTDGKVNSTLMQ